MVVEGKKMELNLEIIGRTVFGITLNRKERCVLLAWCSDTSVPNIVRMKIVCVKLGLPLVKSMEFYTDREEQNK